MKYLLTLDTTKEDQEDLHEDPEEIKKSIAALIEQSKPEAMYFSTIRRLGYIIVNIEDPHVELRLLFEKLSKMGNVIVDPVSTFEEFSKFLEEHLK
jgi:hypothetical protein